MSPMIVGWVELGLGLLFCFVGYTAARVVLGLWGATVGVYAGHLAYQWLAIRFSLTPTGSALYWVVVVACAVLLAWLAFGFYTTAVLLTLGSLGWVAGAALAGWLHLNDLFSLALSALVAGALVVVGWTTELPRTLLIVATALIGAGSILDGGQSLLGHRLSWLDTAAWSDQLWVHLGWTAVFLVLAGLGIWAQLRGDSEKNLRAAYGG